MLKKNVVSLLFVLISSTLFLTKADDIKTVTGEYTFYGDRNHSPEECRQLALQYARINALAKAFGTEVTQGTVSVQGSNRDGEFDDFMIFSETEVKGEWIADVGEPVYETPGLDTDGNYIVKCIVKGKAKAISNETAVFNATVLKNGTEKRFASTSFKPDDELYLAFQSPSDGYIAVYVVDNNRDVYCLLPYRGNSAGQMPVKHNEEYVFFDSNRVYKDAGEVDEMIITDSGYNEIMQVYVIFSPNPFVKSVDRYGGENMPRMLSYDDFAKWLVNARKKDRKMGVKIMNLNIKTT
ncbi:MAG: DUF4384 domain-containing protein [Muribaculaceae bacterium]|nr:DUF4384 domain-containing protein [Muribaculaceae bacterium]